MVIAREGGDTEPELGEDQRKLVSLVPKEVYCSVPVDCSGVLVVLLMTMDPVRKDLGIFHPML